MRRHRSDLNTAKAGEELEHQLSELQAGFLWVAFNGVCGHQETGEDLALSIAATCSMEEVAFFVWCFQSLFCVYIRKGQPRLWAQTEGAQKWLIRVYMKHQLMTGTQGPSILPLPWELHLHSHICLCIHRLPPWHFLPFLDIAHCHGAMLPRGKGTPLLSMLDYTVLRQGTRMGWNKISTIYHQRWKHYGRSQQKWSKMKGRN